MLFYFIPHHISLQSASRSYVKPTGMSGTLDVAPTATLFLNSYRRPLPKAASELHAHTPPDEYDFNFVFDVKTLSSDRVELRPFVVCPPPPPSPRGPLSSLPSVDRLSIVNPRFL